MSKASAISNHPEQAAIDQAILANHETLISLAARFNVSVYSLSRRKKALATVPAVENGIETDNDLQCRSDLLWERSNLIWEQSLIDADTKAALGSLQAGLRSLELAHKRAERRAEAVPEAGDLGISIAAIDKILREADAARTPEVALCESISRWIHQQILYSGDPVQLDLVLQFLRASLTPDAQSWFSGYPTNAALIAEFQAYVARRVRAGDRCDLPIPRRNDDQSFSQAN